MKRSLALVLILGLIAAMALAAPAQAKKKKKKPAKVERVVEYDYQAPSPGISGVVGACLTVVGVDGTACQDIPTGIDEVFVKVEVTDATGQPTNFDLAQDSDPNNPGLEIFASGCGSTSDAVPIQAGLAVRVSVTAVGGSDCPGVATTGHVKATLSNLP
jgi:hypothetical protein